MSYRLVPGILSKIQHTMDELGVRPAEASATPLAAAKKKDRVYMTPVITKRGATVWFKSTLQDWAWVRSTIREEIRIQKLFTAYQKARRPSFDSPTYLASHDDRHGHVWLLRKYWQALYAGDMVEDFGFSDQFFRRISPATMVRALADVRAMTPFVRRRFDLTTHHLDWYMTDWQYYRKTFWRPLVQGHRLNSGWTNAQVDGLEAWLLEQRQFLAQRAATFTHGDFYPNNIMIQPSSRRPLVLFDWELSHLNLPTFDSTMAYLQAWRRPAWQKEFQRLTIRELGDTATTNKAWQITTLSLATRLGAFAWHRLTNYLPERYPTLPKRHVPTLRAMYGRMMRELSALSKEVFS